MADSQARPGKDPEALRQIYTDMAGRFERYEPLDRLFLGGARRRLFGQAAGRVLDVACGTGVNVPYLPPGVRVVGVDLSPAMAARARSRLADLDVDGEVRVGDAADLPFPDGHFDTVLSSLSTCTFPDPIAVLREMDRVCAADGRLLLLEHGRSSVGPIARVQDWWAPRHFAKHGCRWNQEPVDVVVEAGLEPVSVRRGALGVLTSMVVRPSAANP